MAKVEYPKWKYHSELEALIVQSPEHEKALGHEWKESPVDCGPKESAPAIDPLELKPKKAKK